MSKDIIPIEVRDLIHAARRTEHGSWESIGAATGLATGEITRSAGPKRGFRRWVVGKLAQYFDSDPLRRLAESDLYWDRIVSIERVGQRETYDLEVEGNHNFLANDFVVHNSHAASFALIAYASAWLRRHYPAEFTCALLNAQPMGFYSVSTIVEDGKRKGVEIRSVDVMWSEWDCTLEPCADGRFAVRIGLRFVKGLKHSEIEVLLARRASEPAAFYSVDALTRSTRLEEATLSKLAAAGALKSLGTERREALWTVSGVAKERAVTEVPTVLPGFAVAEGSPRFAPLSLSEEVVWDYAATEHSPRGHLLVPLRADLASLGLPDARTIASKHHGAFVRYAGIVICRQRPGTAKGVVFLTMEDETGFVNVVAWQNVFERHALLVKTTSFLGVAGKLQVQDGVVHLIAQDFFVPGTQVRPTARSRDFH